MKVGQLLSMDAGDLLPPELAAVLVGLRADARPLPTSPMVRAMEHSCSAGLAGRICSPRACGQRLTCAPSLTPI